MLHPIRPRSTSRHGRSPEGTLTLQLPESRLRPHFVRALSNYVIVLQNGKVVEEGPCEQIFSAPRTDYTKALLAAAFQLTVAKAGAVAT